MIVQYSAAKPVPSHFSSFTLTLFCCDLFDLFLCFQHGSVFSSLQSECMSVYVKRHCVSFPCVVYFCLFSPLKDRYAFSICIQLLGLLPLDPAGDLPSPDPVLSPLVNFWLRPCAALFKSTMPTCSRNSKLAVHVDHVATESYLPNIFGLELLSCFFFINSLICQQLRSATTASQQSKTTYVQIANLICVFIR